jgi:ribosomal subunit interface protein
MEYIMKTTITSRHFEASEQLKDFANEHLLRLSRVFDRITSCALVMEEYPDPDFPQSVELIVHIPQKSLTAKSAKNTYEKAIHDVVENMKRQLKRYKEKKLQY